MTSLLINQSTSTPNHCSSSLVVDNLERSNFWDEVTIRRDQSNSQLRLDKLQEMSWCAVSDDGTMAVTLQLDAGRLWQWVVAAGESVCAARLPHKGLSTCVLHAPVDHEPLLAYGTSRGDLVVLKVPSLQSVATNTTSSELRAVCFAPDGRSVFACDRDGLDVLQLFLDKAEQDKVKLRRLLGGTEPHRFLKLAVSPSGAQLLTAGSDMVLWDIATQEPIKTFAGHSSPVRDLAFTQDGHSFFSCCEDRIISMWSCKSTGSKKKTRTKKQREPDATFSAPAPPERFFMFTRSNFLSARLENGHLCVWKTPDHQDGKGIKAFRELVNETGSILAAHELEPSQLLLVKETRFNPLFEQVDLKEKEEENVLVLRSHSGEKSELLSKDKEEEKSAEHNNDSSIHVVQNSASVFPGNVSQHQMKEHEDAKEDDTPLGERLSALTKTLQKKISHDLEDFGQRGHKRPRKEDKGKITAGSLSVALEQALQSNDAQMLETCLRNNETKIVGATVERLPSERVAGLLTILVSKVEARPNRGATLLVWIKALLEHHGDHLSEIPELAEGLSNLYQVIDARLKVFDKLLKLSGRLDFIITQISSRKKLKKTTSSVNHKSQVIYDEEALIQP